MDIDEVNGASSAQPVKSARPAKRPYHRKAVRPAPRPAAPVIPTMARSESRAPIRERKHKGGAIVDPFAVVAPPGMTYEWKRKSVYGAVDPSYDVFLRSQGWEPVDAGRHPELVPNGYKGSIEQKGLILMERPAELTQEARDEEQRDARNAVRAKEEQLGAAPEGEFARKASISKTYERPVQIDA